MWGRHKCQVKRQKLGMVLRRLRVLSVRGQPREPETLFHGGRKEKREREGKEEGERRKKKGSGKRRERKRTSTVLI